MLSGERSGVFKTFSFICLLSFDVYVKKQLIESLIDDLNPDTKEKEKNKKCRI